MPSTSKPELYVVDGSNIATEGRSTPSLEQLNDAVMAFLDSHPHATVTVVVDATFGHRIAKKEVAAFDEAVANNELVTPPAGAVGRGDAFVLAIADRAKAGILSNDSFQEFHGEYEWLFDDGRLIGGKPVPHVGWVFVKRSPVRGPKSRQAVREAAGDAKGAKEQANRRVRKKTDGGSDAAATDEGTPAETGVDGAGADAAGVDAAGVDEVTAGGGADRSVGASTSSSRRGRRGRGRRKPADAIGAEQQATIEAAKAVTAPREHVNDLLPFLEFVEQHPVGTSCTVVVESYSSHGAYARVDDVLVYIPLRLMDDPMPRSARSVLKVGEAVTTVIVGYVPDRRSIDAALPHMAVAVDGTPTSDDRPAEMSDTAAPTSSVTEPDAAEETAAERAPAKRAPAKRAPAEKTAAKKAAAKKAPATAAPAKQAAAEDKTAANKTAANKTAAKKTAAKKTAANKTAANKTAANKTAANKTAAKKTAANKTAANKTAANKTAAKKKAPAKEAPAKQAAADTSAAAKKSAAKRAPAKKAAAKKAPARGASARRSAATTSEPS